MAADILNAYDHYDGFVILHGTDTMAYSSASLSFMLADLGKPVVFTGIIYRVYILPTKTPFLGSGFRF